MREGPMLLLRRIYSIYGLVIFILSFLILLPFFIITIEIPGLKKYGRRLNWLWAKILFSCLLIRVNIHHKDRLKANKQYVIIANHFSYLDIPVIGLISKDAVFIGKSSLGKLPLFGYMFRKLHIAVDRSSLRSRGETLRRTKEVIDEGYNIIIFPEGGIRTETPPHLTSFKDGAFNIAQEKQIPIIPVTLSFNHLILPDDRKLLLRYKQVKVVVHPSIMVEAGNKKSIREVKKLCFDTIQQQLWEDNNMEEKAKESKEANNL